MYSHTYTHSFQGHTHTHKHAARAGYKSEEMLMPTNTLRRGSIALLWSLTHTDTHTHRAITAALACPIKLFSECRGADTACLVNPAQYRHRRSSITQACCCDSALKSLRWRPSIVSGMTRPCHLREGISHAVFIGEWASAFPTAAF